MGTDATIQEHISTVLDREYVRKVPEKQSRFAPTPLGLQLIRAYVEMGYDYAFSKPNLRAEMEKDLVRICRGEKTKEEVVSKGVRLACACVWEGGSDGLISFRSGEFRGGKVQGDIRGRGEEEGDARAMRQLGVLRGRWGDDGGRGSTRRGRR